MSVRGTVLIDLVFEIFEEGMLADLYSEEELFKLMSFGLDKYQELWKKLKETGQISIYETLLTLLNFFNTLFLKYLQQTSIPLPKPIQVNIYIYIYRI